MNLSRARAVRLGAADTAHSADGITRDLMRASVCGSLITAASGSR